MAAATAATAAAAAVTVKPIGKLALDDKTIVCLFLYVCARATLYTDTRSICAVAVCARFDISGDFDVVVVVVPRTMYP